MVTSDLRAEVEVWPFRACVMRPAIIIRVFDHYGLGYGADTTFFPQNVFLVFFF